MRTYFVAGFFGSQKNARRLLGVALCLLVTACGGGGWGSGASAGGGSGGGTVTTVTVGGTITGLTTTGLVLANAGKNMSISSYATTFQFTGIVVGSAYAVSIVSQPDSLVCSIANATGTATAAVTNILVSCQPIAKAHVFDNVSTDAMMPYGGLVADSKGNYYGVAAGGGQFGGGAVFKVTAQGNYSIVHSFGSVANDGESPYGDLIVDANDNLYGATFNGGDIGAGNIYKISADGTYTSLVSLGDFNNGALVVSSVNGRLIRTSNGDLYGISTYGGPSSASAQNGVVFKYSNGVMTALHSFTEDSDGNGPTGAIVMDSTGNLYGTTYGGGDNNEGIVYKIASDGTETILHSFAGDSTDGGFPYGGLTIDASGNLYGSTIFGGPNNSGSIFKITAAGVYSTVAFLNSADGSYPLGTLVLDANQNLIGTAYLGGNATGTVFSVSPTGTVSLVYAFGTLNSEGALPVGGVLLSGTTLMGTTSQGGVNGYGILYSLSR